MAALGCPRAGNPRLHAGGVAWPLALSALVFALGCLALAFVLAQPHLLDSSRKTAPEQAAALAQLRDEIKQPQAALAAREQEKKQLEAEFNQAHDEFVRLTGRVEAGEDEVRRLEKQARERSPSSAVRPPAGAPPVSAVRPDAERPSAPPPVSPPAEVAATAPSPAPAAPAAKERPVEFLERYKEQVVTVGTSTGLLGSGFLLRLADGRVFVVTTCEAVGQSTSARVRGTVRTNDAGGTRHTTVFPRAVGRDQQTGLAFLELPPSALRTHGETHAFTLDGLANARAGEQIYTLGTEFLGPRTMEASVYDGNVQALDHKFGGQNCLQVALPANPGTRGSPILNAEGKLLGVLLGPVPGLERAAVAVPSSELANAIQRAAENTGRRPALTPVPGLEPAIRPRAP